MIVSVPFRFSGIDAKLLLEFSHIVPLIRAHLGVPWRIGEKEKAMEIDRLHEDEVLSLSWIRLTRGTGISLVWLRELT